MSATGGRGEVDGVRGRRAPAGDAENRGVPPRAWCSTIALGAAVLALYFAFVRYGVNLDDEGTVLNQVLRTARGERPYLDFHTGYTPAMFYVNALLLRLFGISVLPVRVLLAFVNTLSAVLVFRLALRFAPVAESAAASLAYVLCMPFFAGQFASFNIPYPAWYALAAWLGAELAGFRAVETGRRGWLLATGLLCGVAFSFKPNTGILGLGAAVLGHLLATAPVAGWAGLLLESVVLVVAALAAAAVLGFEVFTGKFGWLGLPLVAWLLAAAVLRARRRAHAGAVRPLGAAVADGLVIVAGFAAANLAWLAYFLPRLGVASFARDVLLLGAGVERIYGLAYPEPSPWSILAVGALLGVLLLPRAIRAGWIGSRACLGLGVGALLGVLAAVARSAVAPEGIVVSTAMQIENLSFFVLPLLLGGAVLRELRAEVRRVRLPSAAGAGGSSTAPVALAWALLLFIQLYPRIDFMHVVISMPSALVVAAASLVAVRRDWLSALGFDRSPRDASARRARVLARGLSLAPIALALASRAAPLAESRLAFDGGPHLRRMTRIASPALPVEVERDRDHDLLELQRVADFVVGETAPGDSLIAFPALGLISFMTGRASPVPHDYFFPGRPSHADEAAMVAVFDADPPKVAITLNDRLGYFASSPAYYFLLRDWILGHYRPVRRYGRFDALLRRDLADAHPEFATPRALGGALSTALAHGAYRDEVRASRRLATTGTAADANGAGAGLADPDRLVRRARLLGILGIARRTPGGLGAIEDRVAPDRRTKLLLLRSVGEFGGRDSLSWLRDVWLRTEGSDDRLARESTTAMNYVLARDLADRYEWHELPANPPWPLPASDFAPPILAGLDDFDRRQRVGPFAALATAAAGRADLAGAIEPVRAPDDSAWWRVVSSYALVRLGRKEYLAQMIAPIETGTFAEQWVPALLLDPRAVDPTAARELVSGLLVDGTSRGRELAAWMSPLLAEPVDPALLDRAAGDPDPAVAAAGRWAAARSAGERASARAPQEGRP